MRSVIVHLRLNRLPRIPRSAASQAAGRPSGLLGHVGFKRLVKAVVHAEGRDVVHVGIDGALVDLRGDSVRPALQLRRGIAYQLAVKVDGRHLFQVAGVGHLVALGVEAVAPAAADNDPLHTDACIWSPGIVICKLDTSGNPRIAPEGWATVDVISCAAPNLRERTGNLHNPETAVSVHLTSDEQYALHLKRTKHILHIAASKRVEALILGAFGCGAFANDPWAVARAYKDALEEYGQYFKYIEFAVYCRDYETENYDAFRQTLCGRR